MFLDAGKKEESLTDEKEFRKSPKIYEKWRNQKISKISNHGDLCCEIAREWLIANDFSELGGENPQTGPRWLQEKFDWGASHFPIYWCEAVRREKLDCGALAAFAYEIFTARGLETYRVQMVQQFSEISVRQWASSWSDDEESLRWTDGDVIYHEGCAIKTENGELKIWDATAGWWIDPKPQEGYGALSAVKIFSDEKQIFIRGERKIIANRWTLTK